MRCALVIGFGGMGCRHTQSLLSLNLFDKVFVIEPSEEVFSKNCKLIGVENNNSIERIFELDSIDEGLEIVIIATLADVRFKYFFDTIKLKPKYVLLEKVVFQSKIDFDKAKDILVKYESKVYGNLPNRYFSNYSSLKAKNHNILSMRVTGPDFGLLCNAIHYIDLFQFLTNADEIISEYSSGFTPLKNKRGDQFLESEGTFRLKTKEGIGLEIVSDSRVFKDVVVEIYTTESIYRFNETSLRGSKLDGQGSEEISLDLIYSSMLTSQLFLDMENNCCLLPTLDELSVTHTALFDAVKSLTGISSSALPIT